MSAALEASVLEALEASVLEATVRALAQDLGDLIPNLGWHLGPYVEVAARDLD